MMRERDGIRCLADHLRREKDHSEAKLAEAKRDLILRDRNKHRRNK